MQSLSNELRGVIEKRLRGADQHEVLAIASMLCARDNQASAAVCTRGPQQTATQRFVVQDDVVHDTTTGLMWTRKNVGSKRLTWSDAKTACAAVREGGFEDWRLPTIQELLSLVDYSRTQRAIDPVFECESAWYWSATLYSSSPSDYAWVVYFNDGHSACYGRNYEYCVRAVRSGHKD